MNKLLNAEDLTHVLYKLLPLKVLIGLAKIQGKIQYKSRPAGKHVHENFKKYFADKYTPGELEQMSRELFEWERVRSLITGLSPAMSVDKLSEILHIEGEEHLDAAIKRGKGAILLGSHLNSIIMFAAMTLWRKRGYDMSVAFPSENDAWGRTKLRKLLEKIGKPRDTLSEAVGGFYCQFNIRPIVKRLKENQIVGQTGDGWHSANFVEAEFLGRKLPFTTASWSIAQVSGAAILPLFITGDPSGNMRIIIEAPVTFDDSVDKKADMEKMVRHYAGRLEHHMLQAPQAWQHWLKPDTLDALVEWTQRDIAKRYEMD